MDDRELLMRRLQVCDFALNDTALYLDIHPEDQNALGFFKRYQELREITLKEYTEKYGPVTHGDFGGGERWKWTDDPWPWHENGGAN